MAQLNSLGWQSTCFVSLLAFALVLHKRLCPDTCSVLIDTPQPDPEYDFIIIGAGSAGAVIANRLSECLNITVLLLEAGGPPPDFLDVPSQNKMFRNTKWDWNYRTEPPKGDQAYCLAMNDHECDWPRGKVVGGSSTVNAMIYTRGNMNDYDGWEAMGNKGWSYHDVLKYFLKSEDNSNPRYLRTPFHSSGGYLNVEDVRYTTPLAHAFVKAGEFCGYKNRDLNGEVQEGFMVLQMTTRKGSRCSTSKAFVEPVQKRPNFHLSINSFVTQVGFVPGNPEPIAKTVTFIKNNEMHSVKAKKEIILSAGAINSPQILMLSGIGPKAHLKDIGIEVVKNLPVGYDLQDHLTGGELTFKVGSNTVTPNAKDSPDAVMDYVAKGRGPLTSTGVEGTAFIYSKYGNRSEFYPDIRLEFVSGSMYNSDPPFGTSVFNLRSNLFDGTSFLNLPRNGSYFHVDPYLLRPKSKGRLKLRSRNPRDHPTIEPNYFANQDDMKVLINGYQLVLKLVDTHPFKEYNATPVKIPFPGCEKFRLFSDEYFECTIRQFTRTNNHPSCTCPMGVGPQAVVDPRLSVIGVKNFRVIDASVMPNIMSGNLNAAVIMIAEKGSDMIKEDWNLLGGCVEQSTKCKEYGEFSMESTKQCLKCKED